MSEIFDIMFRFMKMHGIEVTEMILRRNKYSSRRYQSRYDICISVAAIFCYWQWRCVVLVLYWREHIAKANKQSMIWWPEALWGSLLVFQFGVCSPSIMGVFLCWDTILVYLKFITCLLWYIF